MINHMIFLEPFGFINYFSKIKKLQPIFKFFLKIIRLFFFQDDERIQKTDQCIWATLGGDLATLLAHAQCTEDRLWAYLSCASEALLDDALLEEHAKTDDELSLMAVDIKQRMEDLPRNTHTIFAELRNISVLFKGGLFFFLQSKIFELQKLEFEKRIFFCQWSERSLGCQNFRGRIRTKKKITIL